MAERELQSKTSKQKSRFHPKPLPFITPPTPQSLTPRRSARRASLQFDSTTSHKLFEDFTNVKELQNDSAKTRRKEKIQKIPNTLKSANKGEKLKHKEEDNLTEVEFAFSPVSPEQSETKKRKKGHEKTVVTRATALKSLNFEKENKSGAVSKRKVLYKKVVYDRGEFEVGHDVYVKRREDGSFDDEVVEVEECRVCFKYGKGCDDCLGGFHLKCLKPSLKEVPEGDWICRFCEAGKLG